MTKTAKINYFPTDPAQRKALEGMIEEVIGQMLIEQTAKEQISEIFNQWVEEKGYDKKSLKGWVDAAYDKKYGNQKKLKKAEEIISFSEDIEQINLI